MKRSPIMYVMQEAVHKASKGLVRDFFEIESLQVSSKGTNDFVSIADERTEQLLFDELHKARPDYHFLMEERGEVAGKDSCPYRFIVDPLDGTINFLHGMPQFCITVALEQTHANGQKEIIAAVTKAPILKELYFAEKGQGTWFEDANGKRSRLRVANRNSLDQTLIYAGSLKQDLDWVAPLHQQVPGIRCLGTTALALAYLSAGQMDAFIQRQPKLWDVAAGLLLVKEAGGIIQYDPHNNEQSTSDYVIAANSKLFDQLRVVL